MRTIRNQRARLSAAAAALAIACSPTLVSAQAGQPVRVRGTVVSLDGSTLVVKSRTGETVPILLADTWSATGIVKAAMEDIKPGAFIGTAALPQEGNALRALEIVVFPESMRGTGEGHRTWDLRPNSSMTNATVTSQVQGVDGRTLTLSYKGGKQTVVLPPDAPIVTLAPAERSDITPGAAVFVSAQREPDGALHAARVTVGKNGAVPPM